MEGKEERRRKEVREEEEGFSPCAVGAGSTPGCSSFFFRKNMLPRIGKKIDFGIQIGRGGV